MPPLLDTAGVAFQYKHSEEPDNGNWIAGIEAVRFYLQLDPLHHLENISRRGLKSRQRLFCRLELRLWNFFGTSVFYWRIGNRGVGTRKCSACVTVRTWGWVPILRFLLAGLVSNLWSTGLSVFPAMFPAITPVSGRQLREWLRLLVFYFRWKESAGLFCKTWFLLFGLFCSICIFWLLLNHVLRILFQ